MPLREYILDPASFRFDQLVADADGVRALIPQRFEMQQLDGIIHYDVDAGVCVGFKDITDQEFWVRGHMPERPLMPGVLMCEAAAQVCTWMVEKAGWSEGKLLGFGGLDAVKFRGIVTPGQRFVVVVRRMAMRRGVMVRCQFEAFVGTDLVCEGEMRGIVIPDGA